MGLWNSIFAERSQVAVPGYDLIAVDVHSHLLPGIDDGAATLEESLAIVRGFEQLGYRKLITTPHIMADYYGNTPATIRQAYASLQEELWKQDLRIELEAAAEYMLDDGFPELLRRNELITFAGNHILLELPLYFPHPGLNAVLFELQVKGYQPVLAHAERYTYWFDDLVHFGEMRDRNVLLQVNVLSFTGFYGPMIRKMAERLADQGLIDLLGSDLHRLQSLPAFGKALQEKSLQRLLLSGALLNPRLM